MIGTSVIKELSYFKGKISDISDLFEEHVLEWPHFLTEKNKNNSVNNFTPVYNSILNPKTEVV